MSENKSKIGGDWKPIKFKPKEQAEGESLFYQYCYPQSGLWQEKERKQAALAILSCGIFDGPTLKGHARRGNYSPEIKGCRPGESFEHLIFDLINVHVAYNILPSFLRQNIIAEFDDLFNRVAAIAQIGGVRKDEIQGIQNKWREKISNRALKGKIPPDWDLIIHGCIPLKIAYKFVEILLDYIPQAPPNRIAEWTNAILKSLMQKPMSKAQLNTYISEEKHRRSQLTPIQITE